MLIELGKNFEEVKDDRRDLNGTEHLATSVQVESFTPVYLDRDIETLVGKLVGASKKGYLNEVYFAVMNKRTKDEGSLLPCYSEDENKIDSLRAWPQNSSLCFRGMQAGSGTWDDTEELWEN